MRKFSWVLGCGALLLMSVAIVEGQQEKKGKGGAGGFGGFGGFRQAPGQSLRAADHPRGRERIRPG